jgi:hypothetical protein
VPADYGKIREENIARYGWDTAVLDLLGQLYSERTHFIFELIQNAEDARATEVEFELFADRLELRHNGLSFTEADVRRICGVGPSGAGAAGTGSAGKAADLTAIGQFGIGFKAVYAYTRSPEVHSGDENFRIENYVRPFAAEPLPAEATLFVFPFDLDTVPAPVAAAEIGAALTALQPRILLFLRHVRRLRVGGTSVPSTVVDREVAVWAGGAGGADRAGGAGGADRAGGAGGADRAGGAGGGRRVTLTGGRGRREEWLVWHRRAEGLDQVAPPVEVAFLTEGGRLVAVGSSPLVVFFPTEKETFLGFLVQGPYRTTPARDNVPGHDPANQVLVRETAALLADVLRQLRDEGLLTAEVLQALPLDAGRFEAGTMFAPLFEAVADLLAAEPLVPVAGGGYGVAVDLELADRPGVRELLSPDQLGTLLGAGRAVAFTGESISERDTPALWRYLRDEIGLDEITPAAVVQRVTGEFLAAQTDEWMARFYGFLATDSALVRAARTKPVIRLEDGRQVEPVDDEGRPIVYLPGPGPSRLPTVRRAVAAATVARPFLAALNLAVPDVVAEALGFVLPRYDDLELAQLDLAGHDADLETVVRALDEAPPGPREELLGRLARTPFLIGENAASGEQRLLPPPRLYQRSKELEVYFDQNPDAWFAGDRYGPWLAQLRAMGVRPAVEVRARTPNQLGYVVIALEFGRNERGLGGFDPAAEIDGLAFALGHPGYARSEYVWNTLLAPNRRLVSGVVERSVLPSFADVTQEEARSALAETVEGAAWLPGRDGTFRRPAEVSVDDLPSTFARDEGLAQALGMLQPVVGLAARRLGVPAEVLWGLSDHPDLVALVERELAALDADRSAAGDRDGDQGAR